MPNYTPKNQFEQYVTDSFESIQEKLERCPVNEARIETVEDKVMILEEDKKWYKKIFVFVWGAIGGGILIFFKNILKGN